MEDSMMTANHVQGSSRHSNQVELMEAESAIIQAEQVLNEAKERKKAAEAETRRINAINMRHAAISSRLSNRQIGEMAQSTTVMDLLKLFPGDLEIVILNPQIIAKSLADVIVTRQALIEQEEDERNK